MGAECILLHFPPLKICVIVLHIARADCISRITVGNTNAPLLFESEGVELSYFVGARVERRNPFALV